MRVGMKNIKYLKHKKLFGFTLAEVLITLCIIGIVAAITVPSLINNYQEKIWKTASNVFEIKLKASPKAMNLKKELKNNDTTKKFVSKLAKNFRTFNICDKNHLTDCFANSIKANYKNINELSKQNEYGKDIRGINIQKVGKAKFKLCGGKCTMPVMTNSFEEAVKICGGSENFITLELKFSANTFSIIRTCLSLSTSFVDKSHEARVPAK